MPSLGYFRLTGKKAEKGADSSLALSKKPASGSELAKIKTSTNQPCSSTSNTLGETAFLEIRVESEA
jgi:hypothetical protein